MFDRMYAGVEKRTVDHMVACNVIESSDRNRDVNHNKQYNTRRVAVNNATMHQSAMHVILTKN